MKSILLLWVLCIVLVDAGSPYAKYIDTTWSTTAADLSACKSNCGTCCISSFKIQENGANGAGMNFYFDGTTISRCHATSNGPFSMSFNMITDQPLVVYGFSGVGTNAKLQFTTNGIVVTYNDTSGASCYGIASLVGTLNPAGSTNTILPSLLLIILMLILI